jgi:long-chain acyl-CoA synthetase
VEATPHRVAFRYREGEAWRALTWSDVGKQVRVLAAGLLDLGVQHGDRVALLAGTRVEWALAELAILCAGAAVTTIYPSSTPEDCVFILADAGCTVLIAEDAAQAAKIDRLQTPALRELVCLDGAPPGTITWADLSKRGRRHFLHAPDALEARRHQLSTHDLAALVYTSGTTGRPKGVMLPHEGFCAIATVCEDYIPVQADDEQLHFLPMSHVYGMVNVLMAMHMGTSTAMEGDVNRLVTSLQEVRPTFMAAVPRVFEKVYARVLERARAAGPRRHAIFRWALGVGRAWSQVVRRGERVPAGLAVQHALADRLVFRKVRAGFGGRIRAFASGGAPLAPELAEFFHAAGLLVLEGYGMTESTAISTVNRLDDYRFGSVGRSGRGLDVRLAEDGEILLRGRSVMRGYWNLPDATAETLRDGWLHTGDIGRFDTDGFLWITGRKKHLIITSGGKNIAPQKLENLLAASSELIGVCMVHGDRRPYCTALIALEPEAVASWARARALSGTHAELVAHPELRAQVDRDVQAANSRLASFETIKAWHLIDHEPTVETGELTPSLKVRRDVLTERYRAVLDELYASA